MYLGDTQAHCHHSCISSRPVKGYKNLQWAPDRNKNVVSILAAPVGLPLLFRERGSNPSFCHRLWLFYRGSRLLFMQLISQHYFPYSKVCICLYLVPLHSF